MKFSILSLVVASFCLVGLVWAVELESPVDVRIVSQLRVELRSVPEPDRCRLLWKGIQDKMEDKSSLDVVVLARLGQFLKTKIAYKMLADFVDECVFALSAKYKSPDAVSAKKEADVDINDDDGLILQDNDALRSQLTEKESQVAEKERKLKGQETQLVEREKKLAWKEVQVTEKERQFVDMERKLGTQEIQLVEKERQLARKETQLTEKERQFVEMERQFAEKETKLGAQETQLVEKERQLARKEIQLTEKERQFVDMERQFAEKETKLGAQETQSVERERQLARKETQLTEKERQFVDMERKLGTQEIQLVEKERHLAGKEIQVAEKERQLAMDRSRSDALPVKVEQLTREKDEAMREVNNLRLELEAAKRSACHANITEAKLKDATEELHESSEIKNVPDEVRGYELSRRFGQVLHQVERPHESTSDSHANLEPVNPYRRSVPVFQARWL